MQLFKDEAGNGMETIGIIIGLTIAVGIAIALFSFAAVLGDNLRSEYSIFKFDDETMKAIKGDQA